jgi:hypothetical protein
MGPQGRPFVPEEAVNILPERLESMEKGFPMNSNQQALDDHKRKLQLDALFADEPFLSPTMKARRLHEKLQELRAAETETAIVAPEKSGASDRLFWIEEQEAAASSPSEPKPEEETPVNFADATACLRGPYATSPSNRLYHFRMEVLTQWMRHVPLRETGSHTEAGWPYTIPPYYSFRETEER